MTNKKTPPPACCTSKKKVPFFFIGAIIIVLLLIIFMPTDKNDDELSETPVIEMISDTVNVQTPDNEILDEIVVDENVSPEPEVIENPIMKLDTPNAVVAPEMSTSEKLVQTFLNKYNQKQFKDACNLIVDTKCDATSTASIARFGEEFEKMENGYENISVHQVDVPNFHSDIVCVAYDYRYKDSTNPKPIHEVMSFYVQDGKITYRICEDKTRGDQNLGCPIQSRRDFCLE